MKGRQWVLGAVAVGSLFAATAAWQRVGKGQTSPPDAAQAQTAGPTDTFRLVWSEPAPNLQNASLSSDGANIVTVGAKGDVALWDWARRPARALWDHRIPGVVQAVAGRGARAVLAYTSLDPTRTGLVWLGVGGKPLGRSSLGGAVWDAAVSPDGTYAGVTTGSDSQASPGYLYVFSLRPTPALLHKQALAGVGDSIAIGPNGNCLAVGTWDESGISCYTAKGASRWQFPRHTRLALADRLFNAQIAQGGNVVLGMSYANVHAAQATLYYWRGLDGALVWQYPLDTDALDPQALISEDGRSVAVTYTQMVPNGDRNVAEQRLLMIDAAGNLLWQKGGLLFAPRLASVAADGHRVTVWDGKDTLYHLDNTGRITAPYRFRAPIIHTVGTPNGRWLLVYTEDGMLNLLKLDS